MAALGNILITCVPTPAGTITSKYRDGDDSAAQPPTTPALGQPNVRSSTVVDIPLVTASTGGTAPLAYELSISTTSGIAGFSVLDADADFSGDGVYTLTGRTASTQYWVRLATVDADGRRSGLSGTFSFTMDAAVGGDVTAPTVPTNLAATSTTAGRASLTWTNGTDAVGIAFTDVLRGNSVAGVPTNAGSVIDTVVGTGSSYTDQSAPAGSQVFYKVRHRDAAGNASAYTSNVYVTIASASTGTIKYHPGHYALNGAGDSATTRTALWNEIDASGGWKGGHVRYYWGDLETTLGNYNFSIIDNDLATLSGNGHKMVIQILMAKFGAGASVGTLVPSYLLGSSYNGGVASITDRVVIQMWNTAVTNRIIALESALAARYESNAAVSGVVVSETAVGNKAELAAFGYTVAGFVTQIKRRILAAESDWPTTPHFLYYNFLDTTKPTGADLAQYCLAHNCGLGGPDILPDDTTEGQDVYMGVQGGVDYRGVLPVCYSNQAASVNNYTFAALYAFAKNTLQCGYMNTMMTPDGSPNTRTSIKAYVTANPTMHATTPSIYA